MHRTMREKSKIVERETLMYKDENTRVKKNTSRANFLSFCACAILVNAYALIHAENDTYIKTKKKPFHSTHSPFP